MFTSGWNASAQTFVPVIDSFISDGLLQPVVKVRGNMGERRSWAPKNCWRAFPGPTQALMVRAVWEGLLQLTVGPQFFSEFLGPKFILQALVAAHTTAYIWWHHRSSSDHCWIVHQTQQSTQSRSGLSGSHVSDKMNSISLTCKKALKWVAVSTFTW